MKPILIPCFFVNMSCYFLRMSMILPMSISLNVVRSAFVFCDALSLLAIILLNIVIFSLYSVRSVVATKSVTIILGTAFWGAADVGDAGAALAGAGAALTGVALGSSALGLGVSALGVSVFGASGSGVVAALASTAVSSISINASLGFTLSPSFTNNFVTLPAFSANNSIVDFSMSTTANI